MSVVDPAPDAPLPTRGALRAVLIVALLSRVLVFVAAQGGASAVPPPAYLPEAVRAAPPAAPWSEPLVAWDGQWYLHLARAGYDPVLEHRGAQSTAFFPLVPAVMRTGAALGAPPEAVGLLFTNLCFIAACLLLTTWLTPRLGRRRARDAGLLLAVFPGGLFGAAIYPMGPFLCAVLGAMTAAERGRWGWALVAGAAAGLARPQGVLLVPALAWIAWTQVRRARADGGAAGASGQPAWLPWLAACAPGAALACHMAGLWAAAGDPLAFRSAQDAWGRSATWPWEPVIEGLETLRQRRAAGLPTWGLLDDRVEFHHSPWDLLGAILSLAAAAWACVRLRWAGVLLVVPLTLLPLVSGSLMSVMRFAAQNPAVPALLADLVPGDRDSTRLPALVPLLAASAFALAVLSFAFGAHHWAG